MSIFGDVADWFGGAAKSVGGFLGDAGDSLMGHAAYAPGGQLGSNAQANQLAQAQVDRGTAAQDQYARMGDQSAAALQGLGNRLGAVQAPTIDYSKANAALGAQNNALGMYQQAAQGNGPSAAQAQLQAGNDAAMRAQASAAASARGAGLANAQHDAAQNMAIGTQQNANQAAQLRAQEQQAGMAGYAGLGTNIQSQQAANALAQAQLRAQQQQANAQNQLNAYTAAAGNQLGYNQLGGNLGLQYNTLGQGAQTAQLNADIANQSAQNAQMRGNADAQQAGIKSLFMGGSSAAGQAGGGAGGGASGSSGGMLSAAVGLFSDERVKTNIDGGHAADSFLGTLSPHTFQYTDRSYEPRGDANGLPYLGVMAQDVERTPQGAQAVEQGPDGLKRLNSGALLGAVTAGLGRLHERLSAVEGRR